MNDRQVVVEMVFGSHMYGTDTPESDRDFAGVVMPTRREVLLGRLPNAFISNTGDDKAKNTNEDVDRAWASLHYFIKHCCAGETRALDMLHAPELIQTSEIWERIVEHRSTFYTKSLESLAGYAQRQAARYGIRGSRVYAMELVCSALEKITDPTVRLVDIWDSLPVGDHIHKLDAEPYRFYQVTGSKYVERMKVLEVKQIVANNYAKYGTRAREAAENKNIDWKALSHAMRATMEIIEILEDGTITFPLKEANLLKKVKAGELDYTKEFAPALEDLLDRCEELSLASDLPEKVNRKFWDNFIVDVMEDFI